jgi:hypothetical protein
MTASDLVAALRPVVETLEALGVSYYLTGSVASSAHGVARTSLDADIVAGLESRHLERFVERLQADYYLPVDRLQWAVNARSSCNLIHLATMFKIDLFVTKDRPFDREAARRARPDAVDDTPEAPIVPIASVEDTILAKLEWFRRGGETSERQWWDVLGMLKVRRDIDREYLRRWAGALGVTDLLERALTETDSDAPR